MDINRFNIETTTYLRQVRMFSEQNSIQINEDTIELLTNVVQSIDQLIATAEVIPAKNKNNNNFSLNVSVSWTKQTLLFCLIFNWNDLFYVQKRMQGQQWKMKNDTNRLRLKHKNIPVIWNKREKKK